MSKDMDRDTLPNAGDAVDSRLLRDMAPYDFIQPSDVLLQRCPNARSNASEKKQMYLEIG